MYNGIWINCGPDPKFCFWAFFFITKKKDSFFTTWKKSPHCQEIVQKREALCVCAPQLSSDGLGFFCSTYYPNLGKLKTSFFLFFMIFQSSSRQHWKLSFDYKNPDYQHRALFQSITMPSSSGFREL